jgi:hypothetical protein
MKNLWDKAKAAAGDLSEKASTAASALSNKASNVYEGVTDAAGNRMTHPAVAFSEGAQAVLKAQDMRPSEMEEILANVENPYE